MLLNISICIYEFNLLLFPYIHFNGLTHKQKPPIYLTMQVNVINWIYKCSDSQVLLDIPFLYTNVTKLSYAFQFKITSLNLTKQLHIVIWNHESNLLLYVSNSLKYYN